MGGNTHPLLYSIIRDLDLEYDLNDWEIDPRIFEIVLNA
jgi:hypothetical protein